MSLAAAAALAALLVPLWWSGAIDRPVPQPTGSVPSGPETAAPAGAAPDRQAARSAVEPAGERSSAAVVSAGNRDSSTNAGSGETSPPAEARSSGGARSGSRPASGSPVPSPTFASAGTAVFQPADDPRAGPSLVRADHDPPAAVLKIMTIADDGAATDHVRPSPDGRLVAFDSDRDGERGVYVANADGTDVRRVSEEGFAAFPSWSPDGRLLLFARAQPETPQIWNLWTLEIETGRLRQVTRLEHGQPQGGSWFADSRRIAYGHGDRLVVRVLETGRERFFRSPRKGRPVRTPAVSPDGQRIIFQLQDDGAWLLEVANGSMRRVLEDPTAGEYTWAPDGRRVAFYSGNSDQWTVWVMGPR